jgi:hypothetical protein
MKTLCTLLAIVLVLRPSAVTAAENRRRVDDPRALFPSRIGLFTRQGRVESDNAGDPLAHYWAGSLVLASVYYYRTQGHSLEREYADCKDQVKIASPNARLTSDSAFSVSGHRGRRAIFSVQKGPLAARGPSKSQLVIFAAGDRFLKFRITYPVAHSERAEKEIDLFLRSFPWPSQTSADSVRAAHPYFHPGGIVRADAFRRFPPAPGAGD